MNPNENLIAKFYTAFANADAKTMIECYHPNVHFIDPAFGLLKEEQVSKMWKMLLLKSKGDIKIEFSNIKADEFSGSARWVATYKFSKTNRKVVNQVSAEFIFQDGLIIKHTDNFDVWKWSKQAFGITGYLLGWTGFFQNKIREQALLSLKKFQEAQ
ncbi:nuclear transport factor 2 family protein [Flavobacterium hibisci]|uniref:nuclear transport factor 2 family protein n=1 Tax=Flavobacterium hibisci TaxID=1914462 RepID=UPI001CBF410A|nr:nuclear transport factor 2 family protein [Flavobacterium hibisci]MBZ4044159.1 nuclear transport factor 2 family protein [Flavobacterium hibisci]